MPELANALCMPALMHIAPSTADPCVGGGNIGAAVASVERALA